MTKRDHINSFLVVIIVIVMMTFFGACMCTSHRNLTVPTDRNISAYPGMRSLNEQDSLSAIARQDTAKWNQYERLVSLPGEGGDASCDSLWQVVYGYSLEWKE